jgi:hypothetical protein
MITSLFRSKSQIEPALHSAPEPDAVKAEREAAAAVHQASIRCTELDAEHRSWEQRRDASYRDFCESLKRHADAKEQLAAASKPAIHAGGSVVAAMPVEAR